MLFISSADRTSIFAHHYTKRVAELTKERKVTQKQLAIRTGVTESKTSRFLTKKVDRLNRKEGLLNKVLFIDASNY